MEYKDIYSKYPELATRLVRTSNKLYELSLLGSCNLELSINEMKKIINIKPFSKKAIIRLYNVGQGEGPGLFLEIVCFMKMPTVTEENLYHLWVYDAGSSIAEEHGHYHMLTMESNDELQILLKSIYEDMEYNEGINIKTLDVKSLYLLYNQRKSCLALPNYAKIKTLEVFNMMVDELDSHDKFVMLNLYVMINCVILDIDISNEFMEAQKDFYVLGENEYNYSNYLENTRERYTLIKNIIDAINKF